MTHVVDETYIKRCQNCGKKMENPVLASGYVFCSEECRKMFMASKTT